MTLRLVLIVVFAVAGCKRSGPSAPPPASASPAPPATGAPSVPDAGALAAPDFGPRGRIVATGYPGKMGTGMDDYAEWAGFSADGALLGYCLHGGGAGELRCTLRDAGDRVVGKSDFDPASGSGPDPKKTREIEKWIASLGIPRLAPVPGGGAMAPPLSGEWKYARDIELRVSTTELRLGKNDGVLAQPSARVGGALRGEEPVWVVTVSAPHRKVSGSGEMPYGFTAVNALQLSPDGSELGVVTHSYCMEYCDDFEIVRARADAFAARVYNDTGFRKHEKGSWARSAELFHLATFADPSSDLYPYNLACAWARLGDARARHALAVALERGGEKIKTRAKTDADFAGVRAQAWFAELTR